MEIRKLTESDYAALLELYRKLEEFHVQARPDYFLRREDAYPQEHFLANIANPICLELGAFAENGRMVGFVEATLWNESGMVKSLKTVCLDNIYISPEYRRRGIAAKLFAQVECWAKERGAIRLDLHTWDFNREAIALYRAMGMVPQRYVFEKRL